MKYVYVLRSRLDPKLIYVGLTGDVLNRLAEHNAGESGYTSRHRPWELLLSIQFADDAKAIEFENYLKTGSGRAFMHRHFL
jgi:putative endonuclease